MAWFRGRGRSAGEQDEAAQETGGSDSTDGPDPSDPSEADSGSAAEEAARADEARRLQERRSRLGPLDDSEADAGTATIDLGALRLPARRDLELRLEVQESSRVVSVTVALAGSALQLQAFAAPRTTGIWHDIRTEIAAAVTRQGGSVDEVDGVFGPELVARVPVRTADGRTGHQPSRFVGVDGPRWFLRGVFSGPAAHDPDAAAPLEELLRSCVVVRGSEARPPRELLPLKLPPTAQATSAPVPATAGRPPLAEAPEASEAVESGDSD